MPGRRHEPGQVEPARLVPGALEPLLGQVAQRLPERPEGRRGPLVAGHVEDLLEPLDQPGRAELLGRGDRPERHADRLDGRVELGLLDHDAVGLAARDRGPRAPACRRGPGAGSGAASGGRRSATGTRARPCRPRSPAPPGGPARARPSPCGRPASGLAAAAARGSSRGRRGPGRPAGRRGGPSCSPAGRRPAGPSAGRSRGGRSRSRPPPARRGARRRARAGRPPRPRSRRRTTGPCRRRSGCRRRGGRRRNRPRHGRRPGRARRWSAPGARTAGPGSSANHDGDDLDDAVADDRGRQRAAVEEDRVGPRGAVVGRGAPLARSPRPGAGGGRRRGAWGSPGRRRTAGRTPGSPSLAPRAGAPRPGRLGGRSRRATTSRTSSRVSSDWMLPPMIREPRPAIVTGQRSAGCSPSSFSLAVRQAYRKALHCSVSSRAPPSFFSTWCASARSMLSPPSIRWSPTATRRKPGPLGVSTTVIRLKSVVPPPMSQTRISSPARTSRCQPSWCETIQQ